MSLVDAVRPAQVTLVPDADDQLTSDHGFDITRDGDKLLPVIEQLKTWGCRVSLFMEPDPRQIEMIPALGADRIELTRNATPERTRREIMRRHSSNFRKPPAPQRNKVWASMPATI